MSKKHAQIQIETFVENNSEKVQEKVNEYLKNNNIKKEDIKHLSLEGERFRIIKLVYIK